jgi:hypothetical protein
LTFIEAEIENKNFQYYFAVISGLEYNLAEGVFIEGKDP